MPKLGDPITKKLTSGRFYMQRTGESNFIDLGNVVDYKYNPDIQRAEHQSSARGIKQHDFNLVKGVKNKYELTLDEQTSELRKLKMLGTQAADVVQAAGNVVAEQICNANSKQGRTYFTLAQGLSAVVVKVGAAVKTEGTDYTVDLGSGAITVLEGGTIADNSTVTVDYTKAAVTTQPVTGLKELRVTANFRFVETDQFSEVPRAVHVFSGQLHVTDWGDNNGEDFEKVKIEVLCVGNPVVNFRKD